LGITLIFNQWWDTLKGLEALPQHHAKILNEPWAPLFSWLQEYVIET
jgi:hypothetical protein